ncbi:hypothetical protein [Cellvibrio japonicus]|uniref:Conserved domain protein n=1 Tax=Cellvibrio japonicus (strain Ueda107) TaxID=498211 RepID=B3PFH9_CELJU|nr:hypothetical protein [Cellvibrio japonicus]ACE83630.1 conserved domain protein [Cellvibrio japonicus Ueda107]QEI10847.1 hydroxymyristoyl-ACP dehydratase [Cellvibrio japonicus]QEI14423.1 hydroxymyristoyl-ACP dehydratase [Cellvibrio japonicus]QEI18001.1 hydroxymyristoyl-ACP dehydratase [Cellvibrio japonicus]
MNRQQIAQLIPHGDAMCMLDEVVAWNSEHIHCRSYLVNMTANPLCEHGQLDTVLLIEYGAQAAAVHAALVQSHLGEMRPAYIGAVKDIELLGAISDNSTPLELHAQCLLNNRQGAIYELLATQADIPLLRGRLLLNQPQI